MARKRCNDYWEDDKRRMKPVIDERKRGNDKAARELNNARIRCNQHHVEDCSDCSN